MFFPFYAAGCPRMAGHPNHSLSSPGSARDHRGRVQARRFLRSARFRALPFWPLQVLAARAYGDHLVDLSVLCRAVDPRTTMHSAREANPVGMIVEMDYGYRLFFALQRALEKQ